MSLLGVLTVLRDAHKRRLKVEWDAGNVEAAIVHEESAANLDALIQLIESRESAPD